ncbi:UNVERIFIED_CONTAM: hypothetical protein RMT77_015255 [Armadillidium vulgare]
MGEVEVDGAEPVWNKKWGNSSSEILDGFAFNSFSDATICCNGKRIPVHQMVLAASSDFFREILNSSMSSHPCIIFENVHLKTLEQLLMFIYRGQVFVRPQETRALFRLAEEFKVKGLSGPIGSDVTTKHDFDPPGVDVLNLNLFRKCVNPTKIRDVDILRCKISSLIQKTPRKSRMAESQLIGDFKVSKVKDNKYKIVGCNRTRIYDKEDSNANIHQETSESAREREIFDQFSHISLVEDKAKTFTEEAVKDLVTRLTSHLKIKDQNSLMEGENPQLLLKEEAAEEHQQKESEEPDPKGETQLFERPQTILEDNFESLEKLNHFGIDSISSAAIEVKTMNIPPVLGISTAGPTSAKEYYSCDLCSFTSAHQTRYSRHKKLHCLEGRLEKQKFLNRIAQLRECPGIIKSKPALLSYPQVYSAATMHLLQRCKDGGTTSSVTCTAAASTSKVNDRSSLELYLGGSWEGKRLDSSSIRSHLQGLYDFKKRVIKPTSCSIKGQTKDNNVTCQRYGRRHRRYICLYCSHKTYHRKNLIEHQKVHLQESERPIERKKYMCPNCPFQSHSELYLSLHKRCCRPGKTKNKSPDTTP